MIRWASSTFLALSLWSFVSLSACKKQAAAPKTSTEDLLVGRWELTRTTGGIAGREQPANPSQKQEIIFGSSQQVTRLLNSVVTNTARYSLFQATSFVSGQPQTFSFYNSPGHQEKQFIEQTSATTLVIVDDHADEFGYYYVRR
jgi:hypothetical protein